MSIEEIISFYQRAVRELTSSVYKIPKVEMAGWLALILLSAFLHIPIWQNFISGLVAILSCLIFDFIFWKIRKIPPFLPSAALVTGLILALLVSPTLPIYVPIIAAALAMAFKNFVRVENRHIFNPASTGLFLSGLIFQQNVSWWGVSFQTFDIKLNPLIFFIILISPMMVSILKMKRWKMILSFIFIYGLIFLVRGGLVFSGDVLKTAFLDPTVLFFSLVMLPEPRTSPNQFKWQIAFGIFVAILAFIFSLPIFSSLNFLLIPDPLVTALLIGNLVFFGR